MVTRLDRARDRDTTYPAWAMEVGNMEWCGACTLGRIDGIPQMVRPSSTPVRCDSITHGSELPERTRDRVDGIFWTRCVLNPPTHPIECMAHDGALCSRNPHIPRRTQSSLPRRTLPERCARRVGTWDGMGERGYNGAEEIMGAQYKMQTPD